MTETTKTVFERHEVRKSARQKAAFRDYVREIAAREGYDCREEKGFLGAKNLIVGNPATARVVFTAHYDTCARMPVPNFITPLHIGIYLVYQLAISVVMLALAGLVGVMCGVAVGSLAGSPELGGTVAFFGFYIALLAELFLIMAGPANPHTANDNTSGVTTLLDLMAALPADMRGDAAFIFFDLEEAGLLGSAGYAARHKAEMRDKLLVNFDCVSDGDTILFAVGKKATPHTAALEAAFAPTERLDVIVRAKGVFYPSDQANFPRGVGVAALKKTRRGLLYMDRIHTKRDTVYEEGNIAYLVEGSVRLLEGMRL